MRFTNNAKNVFNSKSLNVRWVISTIDIIKNNDPKLFKLKIQSLNSAYNESKCKVM